ncbi:hypothetical protein [Thalassoroseus pseudoceratinae]|uniref:hypothetical protein n=1 Tax=Thalassoroseus pseudoceratinae TaxID=2713176 RepID=UPI001F0E7030|nr:hypothetical protein [Thalassoroseus pseudoceratinae]
MRKPQPQNRIWQVGLLAGVVLMGGLWQFAWSQEDEDKAAATEKAASEQSALEEQRSVAARYRQFDKTLLKMAEYLQRTDPDRAELLVRAIRMSREQRISNQMDSIVDLLESTEFGEAIERQDSVLSEMQALLKLLTSENRSAEIKAEQERIKDLLKDLKVIADKEFHIRSQTERGEDTERLAEAQGKIAKQTQDLIEKIDQQDAAKNAEQDGKEGEGEGKPGDKKDGDSNDGDKKPGDGEPKDGKPGDKKPGDGKPNEGKPGDQKPNEGKPGDQKSGEPKPGEGKPGEGKPGEPKPGEGKPKPGQSGQPGEQKPGEKQDGDSKSDDAKPKDDRTPGREEIEQARDAMERAIQELKKKNRDGASKEQDEALKKLIEAKEKLEEILRQLREEEREMLLAALEARFLRMLAMQKLVYQRTVGLGNVTEWDENRHGAEAKRLGGDENDIALEAAKALELLKQEGSSVAFPEAVEQLREDMLNVARRLNESKAGELTQAIEKDIIEALGEVLEALKKEMEKLKEKKKQQQKPKDGQPSDPPLVDQLAELKMLRSLQLRINRMTRRLSRMVNTPDGELAEDPDIVDQLQQLSHRQRRIQEATYNLATGRNK